MGETDPYAGGADLASIGARDGRVELLAYDPAWPTAYEVERERLAPMFEALEFHHIGSTAVPGLIAKPIIDMVAFVDDLDAPIAALVQIGGYQYPSAFNATLTHRRFLCHPRASHRTHHLHLVDDREELERRLYFRDRLRSDPVLADAYATLKWTLAARYSHDREGYTDAKAPFIRRVERQLVEERTAEDQKKASFETVAPIPGLVFRAADIHDAEQIGQAVAKGFEGYRSFSPEGWAPRPASAETEQVRALLEREEFWCLLALTADGALAGHVGFLPAAKAWRALEDPSLAHLRQLFVAPAYWGIGLAHALHAHALRAAHERRFTAMRLFTPVGQARARRFYEREGWTTSGEPFRDPGFGQLALIAYRRSVCPSELTR